MVLKVSNITYRYASKVVLMEWSADIQCGTTFIQGPNGVGKSTLLKLVCGALPLQGGEIFIKNASIRDSPLQFRRMIFYCGAGAIPFDHLCVSEYFSFMKSLYPNFKQEAASQLAQKLAITEYTKVTLRSLSSGTQKKVWIAAALAAETEVIAFDEPLANLDAHSQRVVSQFIVDHSIEKRSVILIASHQDFLVPIPDCQNILI